MKVDFIKIIIIVISVLYNIQIQAQEVFYNENRSDSSKTIQLESFSDFPNEIDGCSCCFSKSQEEYKKKMYVFVNDFAALAFVKIDGKLIRFELQNHDENRNIYYYIHNDDKMKVKIIKKTINEDEIVVIEGLITIDTLKGNVKQKFIGECKC